MSAPVTCVINKKNELIRHCSILNAFFLFSDSHDYFNLMFLVKLVLFHRFFGLDNMYIVYN